MKNRYYKKTKHNLVKFFYDGEDYDIEILTLIQTAQKSIHLQVYIFSMDAFGKKIHNELILASKRGVQIYLLIDGLGSKDFPFKNEQQLKEAGIYFCRFNGIRLKTLFRWGRRLHHKILLVDGNKAIIGGINIISAYVDTLFKSPRLDFAVGIEGPITKGLTAYCQNIFQKSYYEPLTFNAPCPIISHPMGMDAKISVNDWVNNRRQITREYSQITDGAQRSITIINSYFFPRKKFIKKLVAASERGVRVRLILPKHSDWKSWVLASQYLFHQFLDKGVEIYQWEKSILHGKLATVDGKWSTIGSFNLNYTSYQGNLEMNVNIYSETFAKNLEQEIDKLIEVGCERIDTKSFSENFSLFQKLQMLFFYIVLALISNFSMAFIFQESELKNVNSKLRTILNLILAIVFLIIGITGAFLPIIPGFPFLFLSFFLIIRQILLNKKADSI